MTFQPWDRRVRFPKRIAMGASESKLSLSYTIKDRQSENNFLVHHKAIHKSTNESVSVFVHKPETLSDPESLNLIQHAVKVDT